MPAPIQQQPQEQPYGAGVAGEATQAIGDMVAAQNNAPAVPQEGVPGETAPAQAAAPQGEQRLVVNNLLRLPPGVLYKDKAGPDGSVASAMRTPIQQAATMSQLWNVLANSPGVPEQIKQLARLYRMEE